MDNLAYLNQISQNNKPKKRHLFGGKKFKVIGIVLGAITFIIVLLAVIANLPEQETDYVRRLALRTKHLDDIVKEYQPDIKSAKLRANSTSLTAVLDGMLQTLPSYYADSKAKTPKLVKNEELEKYYSAQSALEDGKITGLFDRTYARQMSYYINILFALIDDIIEQSNDKSLKNFLTSQKNRNTITCSFT